jgi:sporulation protein YlmC with PRC-barrel domain
MVKLKVKNVRKANSMKTTGKNITACLVAVLSLTLANGLKADEQANSTANAPAKCNKASGIVGMEVRNQNNERLGRVKDVVFDLNNDRVSYAVITSVRRVFVGENENQPGIGLYTRQLPAVPTGFVEVNAKLLAVPLSALRTSSNGKHLILNADKSKLVAAEGFDKNNWPSVTSPSWGAEPFWQTSEPEK